MGTAGFGTSFRDHFTSVQFHSFLLVFFSVPLSSFILAVPMHNCLGKHWCKSYTFFYCHTQWNLLSLLSWERLCFGRGALLNETLTNAFFSEAK